MLSRWIPLLSRAIRSRTSVSWRCPRGQRRPILEGLETRLLPAFNLTIGAASTSQVAHDSAGNYTAIGTGANISVADIRTDLLAGRAVAIRNGSGGSESGDILWQSGNTLDYNGTGLAGLNLTIVSDPSSTGGSVTLNGTMVDSDPGSFDAINVQIRALRDLNVQGSIQIPQGKVSLAADVQPDGSGDDGVGTLTIGSGVVVQGVSVSLTGADLSLDTSAQPAQVLAAGGVIDPLFSGFAGVKGLTFDSLGNLYVASNFDGVVAKVTPTGVVSTFATGFVAPIALAINSQGDLFVGDTGDGSVKKVSPSGNVSIFASGFSALVALAFDASDNLYVSDLGDASVKKVTPSGIITTFVSNLGQPNGIAFAQSGDLLVALNDSSIKRITPAGEISTFVSGIDSPGNLAFGPNGDLFVTQASPDSVTRVQPDGTVSTLVTSQATPLGLAVDGQGAVYIGDAFGSNIKKVNRPATLSILSSVASRPILVGATSNPATGMQISDDELANLSAEDDMILGSPTQRGDITIVSASFRASNVEIRQESTGPGRIVLNDENGAVAALAVGTGTVSLVAGQGGIVATNTSNSTAEVLAGQVTFETTGSIGSVTQRLQLQVSGVVKVGLVQQPSTFFGDGLGDLHLDRVQVAPAGEVNVTTRGNLIVLNTVATTTGQIKLAADVKPDGSGDNGVGKLGLGAGARITAPSVTLTGADLDLDTTASPVRVETQQIVPFITGINTPGSLAMDAQGNLYVASFNAGTVTRVTPGGVVTNFASGLTTPSGLAMDAQGNLYVAEFNSGRVVRITQAGISSTIATNFSFPFALTIDSQGNLYVGEAGSNTVSQVTPDGVVSTYVTGLPSPTGLAFDAQGNLYVSNFGDGTVSRVTPARTISTLATGLQFPQGLAVDTHGNLYVADVGNNIIRLVSPNGTVSTFSDDFAAPTGLVFDAQGNLYVSNQGDGAVRKVFLGSVAIHSSVFSRPMSVGGADNAVAGINLTDSELIAFGTTGTFTLGDVNQSGTITFTSATLDARSIVVQQSLSSLAGIVLDDNFRGPALQGNPISVSLTAGTGGIREVNSGPGSNGVVTGSGSVVITTQGDVGSFSQAVNVDISRLGASTIGGNMFLASASSLTTTGTLSVGGALHLQLARSLTTHANDIQASTVNLLFTTSGVDHFDSGGLTFANMTLAGLGKLVLQSSGLRLTGKLRILLGQIDTADQPVNVGGLTTVDGNLTSGTATHIFAGGLVVNGSFAGGNGPVSTTSVALSAGSSMIIPATLSLSGDWSNNGGQVSSVAGTVIFVSSASQKILSGGQALPSLRHTGTGTLGLVDDLKLAGSLSNTSGAGNIDATNRVLQLGGDWSWGSTGRLLSNGSSVVMTGANQRISGNTIFFKLTKVVTSRATLTFEAGSTQTVNSILTLRGAAGAPLFLRSSQPGISWLINPRSTPLVANVDVQDSRNLNTVSVQPANSHNAGRNIGWVFPLATLTWTGGVSSDWNDAANWDRGQVPNNPDTVIIANPGSIQPQLSSATVVRNLILRSGTRLRLAGQALTVSAALTNQGTLALLGTESVRLLGGNDTRQGTWEYLGNNSGQIILLKDFGASDYFNLVIADQNIQLGTFRSAAGLVVRGNLAVAGGTFDAGLFPTTVLGQTTISGGSFLAGSTALSLGQRLLVSGGQFTGFAGVISVRDVALTGGTLTAPSQLKVSGNWVVSGGTFNAGLGTVQFVGVNQRLVGNTTFFNLSKVVTTADTLTFEAGSTQTVAGRLTLKGSPGQLLRLRSSVLATPWTIQPLGTVDVTLVDVQDARNTAAQVIRATQSRNSGNNSGWTFA
ncbi:MAG: hypothetical protein U0840_28700 [Gemmataceae bacterium]